MSDSPRQMASLLGAATLQLDGFQDVVPLVLKGDPQAPVDHASLYQQQGQGFHEERRVDDGPSISYLAVIKLEISLFQACDLLIQFLKCFFIDF